MANVQALHSVGRSIVTFLDNTYPRAPAPGALPACEFELLSSAQMADDPPPNPRISLYVYRVTHNEHTRQVRPPRMAREQAAPLGLDIHFLLSAWAGTAEGELVTLAWAMRQLHEHPILDASSLSPEAGWGSDEVIQIIPAELSNEDLMRIWDALEPSYRLSVSYIARRVRVDPDRIAPSRPVVATRLVHGDVVPAGVER